MPRFAVGSTPLQIAGPGEPGLRYRVENIGANTARVWFDSEPGGDLAPSATWTVTAVAPTSRLRASSVAGTTLRVTPIVEVGAAGDVGLELVVAGNGFPALQLTGAGVLAGGGTVAPRALPRDNIKPIDPAVHGWSIYPLHDTIIVNQQIFTQRQYLTRVVAPLNLTTTKVRMGPTAYTATGHTYSGYGIFSSDADGGATLLSKYEDTGSPPTTWLDSTNARTVTMTAPVAWEQGKEYWVGPIAVYTGGAINPPAKGLDAVPLRGEGNLDAANRYNLFVTASTVPASISPAAMNAGTNSTPIFWARFIP